MKHLKLISSRSLIYYTISTCIICPLLFIHLSISSVNADPHQIWEDYLLSPNPTEWLKTLPDGSDDHLYFSILSAQNQGDLKTSQRLFDRLSSSTSYQQRFQLLSSRQLIYEILNQSLSSRKKWNELKNKLYVSVDSEGYEPAPLHKGKTGNKSPKNKTSVKTLPKNKLTTSEIQTSLNKLMSSPQSQYINRLSTKGVYQQLEMFSEVKNSDEFVSLLQKTNLVPPQNILEILSQLSNHQIGSLNNFKNLSDVDLLFLLKRSDLNDWTYDQILNTYLKKIKPNQLTSLTLGIPLHQIQNPSPLLFQLDQETFDAYLKRLEEVTRVLPKRYNHLRAHILLVKLIKAEMSGRFPLQPLLSYLKLPQNRDHYKKIYHYQLHPTRTPPAEVKNDKYTSEHIYEGDILKYKNSTLFELPSSPTAVIMRHLQRHLKTYNDIKLFKKLLDPELLYKIWAKQWVLSGKDLNDRHLKDYKKSSDFKTLIDLKLLRFAPYTPNSFKRDEEIILPVLVKGYSKVKINIYHLNTQAYFDRKKQNIPLSLDLGGLKPNYEQSLNFPPASHLLSSSKIKLSQIRSPGSYVIDFIAGNEKMRALIHKGSLTPHLQVNAGGIEVYIIDDLGELVTDASLVMNGREYKPSPKGVIRLPFHQHGGSNVNVRLQQGQLSVLSRLLIPKEHYQLSLKVAAPLLKGGAKEELYLKSRLTLNDHSIPVQLLQDVEIDFTVYGEDQTPQNWKVNAPNFDRLGGWVQAIQFPPRFRKLIIKLSAKIQPMGEDQLKSLESVTTIQRNQDLNTERIFDLQLYQAKGVNYIHVLGRNGESIPHAKVTLRLSHELVNQEMTYQKESDARGRVLLPSNLDGCTQLTAQISDSSQNKYSSSGYSSQKIRSHTWTLTSKSTLNQSQQFTLLEGKSLRFPWSGSSSPILINEINHRRLPNTVTVKDQIASVKPLKAGFYTLIDLDSNTTQRWFVLPKESQKRGALWFTPFGIITDHPLPQMIFEPLVIDHKRGALQLKVTKGDSSTQLHVVASSYALDQTLFNLFKTETKPTRTLTIKERLGNEYGFGQILSEEMRYILKRQSAKERIGNLYPSPSLLINRYELGVSKGIDRALGSGTGWLGSKGSGYGRGGMGGLAKMRQGRADSSFSHDQSIRSWDFLSKGSIIRWAIPLKKGGFELSLKKLEGLGHIHLIVTRGEESVYRDLWVNGDEVRLKDLRTSAPEVKKDQVRAIQRKHISLLKERSLTLPDLGSRWKGYQTLGDVYELYQRLLPHANLQKLARLLKWPQLSPKDRLELYSELGGHEVDFFLYHKDPAFFKSVIRPLIIEKGAKDFLDRWMIGQSVTQYKRPNLYAQLNILERILLDRSLVKTSKEGDELRRRFHLMQESLPQNNAHLRSLFNASLARSLEAQSEEPMTEAADEDGGIDDILMATPSAAAPRLKKKSKRRERRASKMKMDLKDMEDAPAEMEEEQAMEKGEYEKVLGGLRAKRAAAPKLYKTLGETKRWAERRYDGHLTPLPHLITQNAFWTDYAHHQEGPFLSSHFPEAATNFTSAWMAIALLELPFTASKAELKTDGSHLKIQAKDAGIFFYEGASIIDWRGDGQISIRRTYRPLGQPKIEVKTEGGEWRIGAPYQVQIITMNPSAERLEFDLHSPLPNGAIPLLGQSRHLTQRVRLNAYATKVHTMTFYFPEQGSYIHPASYAIKEGKLIGVSPAPHLNAVEELTQVNQESWEEVARLASHRDVLKFIRTHNLYKLNLSLIYNRLPHQSFYRELISLLSAQQVFDQTVWSYSILHRDHKHLAEYLSMAPTAQTKLSPYFKGKHLTIDAGVSLKYQQIDFDPLVPSRAHSRGKVKAITHPELKTQYVQLLRYLAHKPRAEWSVHDHLALSNYLLNQGRIDAAIMVFDQIPPPKGHHLHYDYLTAYLSVYRDRLAVTYQLADHYQNYPHLKWRARFNEMQSKEGQSKEAQPKEGQPKEGQPKEGQPKEGQDAKKQTIEAQSLEFKIEKNELVIDHQGISSVNLRLYPIDLEVLFSESPTSAGDQTNVAPWVTPVYEQEVQLSNQATTRLPLPEKWKRETLLVEMKRGALSRIQSYSPQSFKLYMYQHKGRLNIKTSPTEPSKVKGDVGLGGAYVKVYVQLTNNQVKFHKDGYTDHRGLFDYVNAHPSQPISKIKTFFILVLTKEHGATTRSVSPPAH